MALHFLPWIMLLAGLAESWGGEFISCQSPQTAVPDPRRSGLDLPLLIWKLESQIEPGVTDLDSFFLFEIEKKSHSSQDLEAKVYSPKSPAQVALATRILAGFEPSGDRDFNFLKERSAQLDSEGKLFLLSMLGQRLSQLYPEGRDREVNPLLAKAALALGFRNVGLGADGRLHLRTPRSSEFWIVDVTMAVRTREKDPARAHAQVRSLLVPVTDPKSNAFRVYRPRTATWAESRIPAPEHTNYGIGIQDGKRTARAVQTDAKSYVLHSELSSGGTVSAARFSESGRGKASALAEQLSGDPKIRKLLTLPENVASQAQGTILLDKSGKLSFVNAKSKVHVSTQMEADGLVGRVGAEVHGKLPKGELNLTLEREVALGREEDAELKYRTRSDQISLVFDTRGDSESGNEGSFQAYVLYEGQLYFLGGVETMARKDIVHRFKLGFPTESFGQVYTIARMGRVVEKLPGESQDTSRNFGIGIGLEKRIGDTTIRAEIQNATSELPVGELESAGEGVGGSLVIRSWF